MEYYLDRWMRWCVFSFQVRGGYGICEAKGVRPHQASTPSLPVPAAAVGVMSMYLCVYVCLLSVVLLGVLPWGRRMESLLVVPISQVSSLQRAGRAGRTGVFVVFELCCVRGL